MKRDRERDRDRRKKVEEERLEYREKEHPCSAFKRQTGREIERQKDRKMDRLTDRQTFLLLVTGLAFMVRVPGPSDCIELVGQLH